AMRGKLTEFFCNCRTGPSGTTDRRFRRILPVHPLPLSRSATRTSGPQIKRAKEPEPTSLWPAACYRVQCNAKEWHLEPPPKPKPPRCGGYAVTVDTAAVTALAICSTSAFVRCGCIGSDNCRRARRSAVGQSSPELEKASVRGSGRS